MYCDDAYVCRQRTSADIEAGAITEASNILADGSVIQAKMKDLSVGTPQLALLAVAEGNIAALAVTSAKIGLLAVDTLHVKGNAITTMIATYTATETHYDDYAWHEAQTATIVCTGAPVLIIATIQWKGKGDNGINIQIQRDNTTTVYSINMYAIAQFGNPFCVAIVDAAPSAASHDYDLDIQTTDVDVGDPIITFSHRSLVVKEVKK